MFDQIISSVSTQGSLSLALNRFKSGVLSCTTGSDLASRSPCRRPFVSCQRIPKRAKEGYLTCSPAWCLPWSLSLSAGVSMSHAPSPGKAKAGFTKKFQGNAQHVDVAFPRNQHTSTNVANVCLNLRVSLSVLNCTPVSQGWGRTSGRCSRWAPRSSLCWEGCCRASGMPPQEAWWGLPCCSRQTFLFRTRTRTAFPASPPCPCPYFRCMSFHRQTFRPCLQTRNCSVASFAFALRGASPERVQSSSAVSASEAAAA
mmetsp:Transcript_3141/g.6500  ORF Transcript_3141/g.6500 Transcript_3141/m.6500 type:complete len:257 (+) Transcript_3141:24-794(+)